jgi:hypothetical protein
MAARPRLPHPPSSPASSGAMDGPAGADAPAAPDPLGSEARRTLADINVLSAPGATRGVGRDEPKPRRLPSAPARAGVGS